MAELVTLGPDSPLGPEGAQVWVDDPKDAEPKHKAPAKKAAAAKADADS